MLFDRYIGVRCKAAVDVLHTVGVAPSTSSVGKRLRAHCLPLQYGYTEAGLAAVLAWLKTEVQLVMVSESIPSGSVLVCLSEDETCISGKLMHFPWVLPIEMYFDWRFFALGMLLSRQA